MINEGRTLYFEWEVLIMSWLQSHMGPAETAVASFFTMFGEELILVILFGLIYWCIDKKAAKTLGTCFIVALILNPMIKNIVLRRRPYFDHESIDCLRPVNKNADIYDITFQGYSFPSAHTLNATVMYMSLCRMWKKPLFQISAVVLPLLVAASRVMLGVHYPTDVITGGILGILIVMIVPAIQERIKDKGKFRLILFLLSLSGLFYCRTDDYFTALGMMAGFFTAIAFEEKYVDFAETGRPVICLLRIAGGALVYYISNTLLKLPFSKEFLESGTMSAHLTRSARYAVVIFLMFAIYPMLFGKIGSKPTGDEEHEQ